MEDSLEDGVIKSFLSPQNLQEKCISVVVSTIVKAAIPNNISLSRSPLDSFSGKQDHSYKDPHSLDVVLMSTEERHPELLQQRISLMDKLKQVRRWYKQGGLNSEMLRQIRIVMSESLGLIDPHSFIPLYKFTLELLFGNKVSGCSDPAQFPFFPKVKCELWRKDCPFYAEILRSFAPFDIEELSTQHIAFGDPQPLLVIIENSPSLKRVHLCNNICEEILHALHTHCPLVNTFHMEKCLGKLMVPVNCLYETFFSGMSYTSAMEFLDNSSHLERQKHLSFPKLKSIHFGKMDSLEKKNWEESLTFFVHMLLYCYSHTMNITSDTFMPFPLALCERLPSCMQDISYNISNCSLNVLFEWAAGENSKSESDIKLPISCVQYLTISHPKIEDEEMQKVIDFSKTWIPKLGCNKLLIYILHEGSHTNALPMYEPLFSTIGNTLTSLHFNIDGNVSVSELCDAISLCSNLELLRLKILKFLPGVSSKCDIKRLWKLTSVSITIHSDDNDIPPKFIEKLIESSPELYSLSMVLLDRPCAWLMSLASEKKLNNIKILRLSFQRFIFSLRELKDYKTNVGLPFYGFLIPLLPNLKVLQLGSLPYHTFKMLKEIYQQTDLQINIWHVPIDSKEWYG